MARVVVVVEDVAEGDVDGVVVGDVDGVDVVVGVAAARLVAAKLSGRATAAMRLIFAVLRRRSVGTFTALSSQGSAIYPTCGRADRSRYPPPSNQASERRGASRVTLC